MSRWGLIFWSLSAFGGLWAILVSLLLNPWLQRHALYAHRFHTAWLHNLSRPESFGFAEAQVSPFRIFSPSNDSLYVWHILPMGLYAQETQAVRDGPRGELDEEQFRRTRAFELLSGRNSRLIINFHGNAGHVAQGWRTDSYKSLSAADGMRIHILTFDYRGFGTSTGEPSEEGLIADGISIVEWALNVAQVPPQRVLLLGQSLGTAVATAVAEHFATTHPGLNFAGLLLCSGFSDIPSLMQTYAIGGFVPILSPLKSYPTLLRFFSNRIIDTWHTSDRLERLAGLSSRLRLRILHARNDFDIGWRHSDVLFNAAVAGLGTNSRCLNSEPIDMETNSTEIWKQQTVACQMPPTDTKVLSKESWASRTILYFGGHNRITASNYVAVALRDIFDAAEKV